MENIYLGIRVVFPLLLFMVIGITVQKNGWVGEKTFAELNRLVFRVFMPVMLFLSACSVNIREIFSRENVQVLVLAVTGVILIYICAELLCGKIFKDGKRKAVVVQGTYRSNLVLFGLPVSMTIYGAEDLGVVSMLIITIVPLYNIIAAVLLGKAANHKMTVWTAAKKAFSNPLVLGAFGGIIFNLLGGTIPGVLVIPLEKLGGIATPLAFIVLGGSLMLRHIKEEQKVIIGVCAVRLVLVPAVVMGIAVGVGITGSALTALIAVFASPIAVSSYTMAKEEDVAPELAGALVAVTTLVSVATMCGWITWLGYYNLL